MHDRPPVPVIDIRSIKNYLHCPRARHKRGNLNAFQRINVALTRVNGRRRDRPFIYATIIHADRVSRCDRERFMRPPTWMRSPCTELSRRGPYESIEKRTFDLVLLEAIIATTGGWVFLDEAISFVGATIFRWTD